MKSFKDFGITSTKQPYTGEKISINRVLNREIIIHEYKIEKSKFEDSGTRLTMQISLNGTRHVLWTGSLELKATIAKIPADGFPFKTTIVDNNKRWEFT